MEADNYELEPLELWFKEHSKSGVLLPNKSKSYFTKYIAIKDYLEDEVYKYIGAATSAEDQGIYTDHSKDHFNAVIRYAGRLLNLSHRSKMPIEKQDISLNPYEVYITLVSILLHDAGNINGRAGHEKRPLKILLNMGPTVCPDQFEARPIAAIARAHGGKVVNCQGEEDKDTIRNASLNDAEEYQGATYRPKLLAALVRFSDEICEDRKRAARFIMDNNTLPEKSEIYHKYANSISNVSVDIPSKTVNIKYEITKTDVLKKYGKNDGEQYLIDEINERLEKMFSELLYCKSFMYEVVNVNRIRATVTIYDVQDDDLEMKTLKNETFELIEEGYPSQAFSFKRARPSWCGKDVKKEMLNV